MDKKHQVAFVYPFIHQAKEVRQTKESMTRKADEGSMSTTVVNTQQNKRRKQFTNGSTDIEPNTSS